MHVGGVDIEVTRKRIKHLHLKVHRTDGRVRVSAPWRMTEGMIRSAVASRFDWIHRQLQRVADRPRTAPPRFVTGERHFFQGEPRVLNVVERKGRARVRVDGDRALELGVGPGSDAERRRSVLEGWYREHLRGVLPGLVRRWEPVMQVDVAEWRIKRMKTRWGTCNPAARRIWLNLELAKWPPDCLEYVVVHEMVHLLEQGHNNRFYDCMDRFLPGWRAQREALQGAGSLPAG